MYRLCEHGEAISLDLISTIMGLLRFLAMNFIVF